MSKRAKISFLCLSSLAGVASASFQKGEVAVLVGCFAVGIIFYISGKYFFIAVTAVFLASFLWLFLYIQKVDTEMTPYTGKEIITFGKIASLNHDGLNTEALFSVQKVSYQGVWKKVNGKVSLANSSLENIEVGDTTKISGNFSRPTEANALSYNFSKNISGDLYVSQVEKNGTTFSGEIQKNLARFHDFCLQKMTAIFPYPVDAMLGALLLGARTEVPKSITDAFKATGTTHILALSGYNISIIFATIELLLSKFMKPRARYVFASVFIVTFVFLAGLSSSIVRAAVMGILAGSVSRSRRITNAITILLFASSIMVILNPKILVFDVSFQLSALATFGIVAFQKMVEEKITFIPNFLQIREILATTISAQIPVIPILVSTFHSLSTLTLLANILVLPLVPLIMATGFVGVLLSFISIPIAKLFAPLPSLLVNIMDGTLDFLSRWHFALLSLRIPLSVLVLYSLFVLALYIYLERKKSWE